MSIETGPQKQLDAVAERLRALRHAAEERGAFEAAEAISQTLREHLQAVQRQGVIDLEAERDRRGRS